MEVQRVSPGLLPLCTPKCSNSITAVHTPYSITDIKGIAMLGQDLISLFQWHDQSSLLSGTDLLVFPFLGLFILLFPGCSSCVKLYFIGDRFCCSFPNDSAAVLKWCWRGSSVSSVMLFILANASHRLLWHKEGESVNLEPEYWRVKQLWKSLLLALNEAVSSDAHLNSILYITLTTVPCKNSNSIHFFIVSHYNHGVQCI